MTQTEITLKLRDDCIMILDAAKAWPGPAMEGRAWKEKQSAMDEIMKSHEACEGLISRIDEAAMGEAAPRIFSNGFIRGTAKLLRYRIDANDMSVGPAARKRRKTSAGMEIAGDDGSWGAQLDAAARAIRATGQTVLGYKMIQELGDGDPAAVARLVGEELGPGYGSIEISMVLMNAPDLREKMNYMNHRIWLIEPSLPVYLASAKRAAKKEKGRGLETLAGCVII